MKKEAYCTYKSFKANKNLFQIFSIRTYQNFSKRILMKRSINRSNLQEKVNKKM